MRNREENSTYQRASFLYYFLAVIAFIVVARLFYLQVVKHDYYKQQALSEHESKFDIPAQRGSVYALDGSGKTPVVLNEKLSTVYVDPSGVEEIEETATKLSEILGVNESEIAESIEQNSELRYLIIAKRVDDKKRDMVNEAGLKGVGTQEESYRVYPQGKTAAQVVGFVNGERVGQYGVEEALDSLLAGQTGRLRAVTDVYGIPLTTNEDNIVRQPVDGKDLTLTIDINVQKAVEDALAKGVKDSGGKSGSAIVMDPRTGAIKAMANYPTYNPANFADVKDFSVFQNDVVSAPYEVGSIMKVLTMAAGLNEGVVSKDSTYYDPGFVEIDGWTIENAEVPGNVTRTMTEVIEKSVNTGVVHVLKQLGGGEINKQARDILYKYFTEVYGLGTSTGLGVANEAGGSIIDPDNEEGNGIRYANMTFGQGMTVTTMQMAAAASAVLNGGDYYKPYIVHSTVDENNVETVSDPQILRSGIVSPQVSRDIRSMMETVIGTNTPGRDGYSIGGKTGTSQVIDEETGEYSDTREVGSFLGFVGTDSPEYVVITRVEEPSIPGYAGTVAAGPIFVDIYDKLINYYQIPPR